MNQNQKRILIAVSAIIVSMLVYPPFQVIAPNGGVFNMGYNWLIDPPMRSYITATVNVSMLLIQWIGVLVVGGIAFFLAKKSTQEPQNPSNKTIPSINDQNPLELRTIMTVEKSTSSVPATPLFRDPTQITKWLRFFLYASIANTAIVLISDVLQYQLLSDFKLGMYSSSELAAVVTANDNRQQLVFLLQMAVLIPTVILFAMWIYRANFNARALGAQNMKFTPSWAVGYYFVPILNLWRPYQAMKEIWKASKNPLSWESEGRGAILPWWWFLFLVENMFGKISLKIYMNADEIYELIASTGFAIATNVVSVPATIAALIIVKSIYELQMSHISNNEIDVFQLGEPNRASKPMPIKFAASIPSPHPEPKQYSISSHNLDLSHNNQSTVETDVTEKQRPSARVHNRGDVYNNSFIFQKMKGSHEMLKGDNQTENKWNWVQWLLLSLSVLFMFVPWIVHFNFRPTSTTPVTHGSAPAKISNVDVNTPAIPVHPREPEALTMPQDVGFPPWYKDHAFGLMSTGRWSELIDVASRWKENEPENPNAWYLLGEGYLGLGRTTEALASFRQILQTTPTHYDSWKNYDAWKKIAVTYIKAGQPEVARDIAFKMKKIDPKLAQDIDILAK